MIKALRHLFFTLIFLSLAHAQSTEQIQSAQINQLRLEIDERSAQIENLNIELSQAFPVSQNITQSEINLIQFTLEQLQQNYESSQSKAQETETTLNNLQRQCDALTAQMQRLANPLANPMANSIIEDEDQEKTALRLADCQQKITETSTLLTLQKNLSQLLKRQIELQEKKYQRYNDRWLQTRQSNTDDNLYKQTLEALNTERDILIETNISPNDRSARLDRNIELSLISRQIILNNLMQEFSGSESRLQELQFADFIHLPLERLIALQEELRHFDQQLRTIDEQLKTTTTLIEQQYELYQRQQDPIPENIRQRHYTLIKESNALKNALESAQISLNIIRQTVNEQHLLRSKEQLTANYFKQHNWDEPKPLLGATLNTLTAFIGQYSVSFKTLIASLKNLPTAKLIQLSVSAFAVLILTIITTSLANHLVRNYKNVKKIAFSTRIILFIFGMGKYNLPYVGLLALTWLILKFSQLPSPGFNFILLLPILFLFITIPYFWVHTLTASELLAASGRRYRLRTVTITALIGALLLSFVLMAQWIVSSDFVIDTFRWIYGLYILIISIPLWRYTKKTIQFLNEHYQELYTYRLIRIIVLGLPLAFFLFGIISSLGYLNLAWLIARHLLATLSYALIWVGLLGLFKDLSLNAKQYVLKNTNNSVFWAQDVINPLHSILRYSSFIIFLYILTLSYKWDSSMPIIAEALKLLRAPLFGDEDSQFTLMNLLLMSIIIYVIFRFGAWMKSLCYRWVYAKVHDTGMRNSLAVFTQYALVTLGFFLALRIIGIDLTAFTIFAGALGVGIGFGLQTIANNFISGILLLIERPLRNGDIITAGTYTGTVERIGMRTLTLTTFDNESVILPNSDFVTSAFINWSHTDAIVRVVTYFDLSYRHDPHDVQNALFATLMELAQNGHIIHELPDMDCGVFAWNYSERGITYRVQFYLHIDNHGLLNTRHKVFRALWRTCQEKGFEFAYPKLDMAFREQAEILTPNPEGDTLLKQRHIANPKPKKIGI